MVVLNLMEAVLPFGRTREIGVHIFSPTHDGVWATREIFAA